MQDVCQQYVTGLNCQLHKRDRDRYARLERGPPLDVHAYQHRLVAAAVATAAAAAPAESPTVDTPSKSFHEHPMDAHAVTDAPTVADTHAAADAVSTEAPSQPVAIAADANAAFAAAETKAGRDPAQPTTEATSDSSPADPANRAGPTLSSLAADPERIRKSSDALKRSIRTLHAFNLTQNINRLKYGNDPGTSRLQVEKPRHHTHGALQKGMKRKNRRASFVGGSMTGSGLRGVSGRAPAPHHGPAPNDHSEDHKEHKGYIDGVIRDLMFDENRGASDLVTLIVNDVSTNIDPGAWSLCRRPRPVLRENGEPWDLESIKRAHPAAARRVALSIIESGVNGLTFDKFCFDSRSIAITDFLSTRVYRFSVVVVAACHCILGWVEQSYYYDPYSHFSYLDPWASLPIEIIIVGLFLVDVGLRFKAARNPCQHRWLVAKFVCSLVFLLDILLAFQVIKRCNIKYYRGRTDLTVEILDDDRLPYAVWFRMSRWMRPLILLDAIPSLRKESLSIIHVLHALLPVLFLLLMFLLTFSIIALFLHPRKEMAAMAGINPTQGDLYFGDLYQAMVTWAQVLFGGVIWPDVTLPAMIEQSVGYFTVFLFFAAFSVIVWSNLLTAVVFQAYNERAERDALDAYMQAHVACAMGFMLLSQPSREGQVMSLKSFIGLMRELRPQWNPINFVLRGGQLVNAASAVARSKPAKNSAASGHGAVTKFSGGARSDHAVEMVPNPTQIEVEVHAGGAATKSLGGESGDRAVEMVLSPTGVQAGVHAGGTDGADVSADGTDGVDGLKTPVRTRGESLLSRAKEGLQRVARGLDSIEKDQIFLVVWRELKKIGGDLQTDTPGSNPDDPTPTHAPSTSNAPAGSGEHSERFATHGHKVGDNVPLLLLFV